MTIYRFYAPEASTTGETVTLSDSESHHLTSVLRLRAGDTIRVFDGRGHEYTAQVKRKLQKAVSVLLVDTFEPAIEPRVKITLAPGLLKGRGLDTIIRNATMLGVAVIQPLLTARANVYPTALSHNDSLERWHKIAVSSAKQSGRAVVPIVAAPISLGELLVNTTSVMRIMLVEPASGVNSKQLEILSQSPIPPTATLAIGPEGGWSASELQSAHKHNFQQLTLGVRTFRADAAPMAAISVLQFLWGDL